MNKPFLTNRILLWVLPLLCWACPAKQPVEPATTLKMTAQLGKYIVYVQNQEQTDLQNVRLELKAPVNGLRLDTFQYVIDRLTLRAGGRDSFYYQDFIDNNRGGYHYPLSIINKPASMNVQAQRGTETLLFQIKF
ncbi:MAG: hypothetical protein RIS64_982 [Bacteroidota bacterium]|jgi:hypothetical protein